MKFLVDEQLPRSLAVWLRGKGLDAQHVVELGLAGAPDRELISRQLGTNGVVLTKDADFVRERRRADTYRVVRITTGNLSTQRLLSIVQDEWSRVLAELESGALVADLPAEAIARSDRPSRDRERSGR